MANEVAKTENEVKYQVDGREIVLSTSLVRKYLVRGHGNLVTAQEMALFVGVCRARGMDPWAGDVYIIKYAEKDPAAIVTSIDFVRARARTQPDCQGWTCGVIVAGADGEPRDSSGLVMEGEKILGGWAECQPKGWIVPMRLEVNLSGYLKKTQTGQITKFWQPENQPTMISKVAEMQILRKLWPAAAGKMYIAEEVGGGPLGDALEFDMAPGAPTGSAAWEQEEDSISDKFGLLAIASGITDLRDIQAFITSSATTTKKTEDELMSDACGNWPSFMKIYHKYVAKKAHKEKERAEIEVAKANIAQKSEPKGAEIGSAKRPAQTAPAETVDRETGEVFPPAGDGRFVVCSKKEGDEMSSGFCETNCDHFSDPMGNPQPRRCLDYMSDKL